MSGRVDVVVLGGDLDALVLAAKLGQSGARVLLLERRAVLGGVLAVEEFAPGYRICRGLDQDVPSHPVLDRLCGLSSSSLPQAQSAGDLSVVQPDGDRFRASCDAAGLFAELSRTSEGDGRRLVAFQKRYRKLSQVFRTLLLKPPPDPESRKTGDLLDLLQAALRLRGLGSVELYEFVRSVPLSAKDLLEEWFESPWLQMALAAKAQEHSLLGPRSAGGGMRLLHAWSLGFQSGIMGCPSPLPAAQVLQQLESILAQTSVTVRRNAVVDSLIVNEDRVTGVVLAGGEEIPCGFCVSSKDPQRTLLDWVDPAALDSRLVRDLRSYRTMGTASKVHLAVDRLPGFLMTSGGDAPCSRAILAGELDDLERVADASKYQVQAERPVLEVSAPSQFNPSLAPEGHHVLSVTVYGTPHDLKGSWQEQREALGDRVVGLLGEADASLASSILQREVLTPVDLARELDITQGHLHHGDLMLDQFHALRPTPDLSRYESPIRGLYLCGQATHPGGPPSGWSGAYVAEQLIRQPALQK